MENKEFKNQTNNESKSFMIKLKKKISIINIIGIIIIVISLISIFYLDYEYKGMHYHQEIEFKINECFVIFGILGIFMFGIYDKNKNKKISSFILILWGSFLVYKFFGVLY